MNNLSNYPAEFKYEETRYDSISDCKKKYADWKVRLVSDSIIAISKNNAAEKLIKVKDDPEWAIKAQKTQIKSRNGANGLFQNMYGSLVQNEPGKCMYNQVLNHAWDNMRPSRA